MADVGERLDMVERRLRSVETGLTEVRKDVHGLRIEIVDLRTDVGGLRGEVGGLHGEMGGLRGEVGGLRSEVGGLRSEVNGLRIFCERNEDDIRKIAEVQVHHGRKLDEITRALEPLAQLEAFVRVVAHEHERRIKALEERAD
jgi:chromosome segregation ATPase